MRKPTFSRLALPLALAAAVCAFTGTSRAEAPTASNLVRPLLVGSAAPEVTVYRPDGSAVDLPKALSGKWSIVLFYRGGW